jgi:hypothetical protein
MKKLIVILISFTSFTVSAHDGDHCQNPFFQSKYGATTGIQGLAGQYKAGADQFDYFVTSVEAGYSYKNRFLSTVRVPFVALENNQDTEFLLSDIQVQLQGSLLVWGETNFLSLGLNTEIPTGNEDKLVGGGHMHFRPYLGFQQNLGKVITYGQTGMVVAAKNHDATATDHTHDEATGEHVDEEIHGSVVDVHSSREATFQLGAVVPVVHNKLYFNTSLAGQTVLTDINANMGDLYMTVNPALTLMLTENSNFTMFSQIPVTNLQRFDYRLGAGINYIF